MLHPIGPVLVQLLVEQQEEVSEGEEGWGENKGAQHKPGLDQVWRLRLLSEVLSGWGACDGEQFSQVIASTEPGARMSEYESQLP